MKVPAVVCAVVLLAVTAGQAPARAEEFSADMVTVIGGSPMQGQIAVSGDKARMDIGGMVTITRIDQGVVWVVMPEAGTYMEVPLDSQHLAAVGAQTPEEMDREYLGSEMIDRRNVEKYRISYDLGDKGSSVLSWVIPESGIPVRIAAEDGSWSTEYRNIREGAVPASSFELPSGYQQLIMPANALEGMGGIGGLSGLKGLNPGAFAQQAAEPVDPAQMQEVLRGLAGQYDTSGEQ